MTIDHMIPTSLDDIYGPGADDAFDSAEIETTYEVRVGEGRSVTMIGDQADLDKILVAMRMMREDYTVSEFVSDWQEWINRHDGDTVEALRVALFQRDTAYEEVKQMLHAQWDAELEASEKEDTL